MILSVELLKTFGLSLCSPNLNDLLYDADADGKFVNAPIKRRLSLFLQRANEPVPLHLATDQIDWPGFVIVVKGLSGNDNAPAPTDQVSINHKAALPSPF